MTHKNPDKSASETTYSPEQFVQDFHWCRDNLEGQNCSPIREYVLKKYPDDAGQREESLTQGYLYFEQHKEALCPNKEFGNTLIGGLWFYFVKQQQTPPSPHQVLRVEGNLKAVLPSTLGNRE